jgi:hypothetical protein
MVFHGAPLPARMILKAPAGDIERLANRDLDINLWESAAVPGSCKGNASNCLAIRLPPQPKPGGVMRSFLRRFEKLRTPIQP